MKFYLEYTTNEQKDYYKRMLTSVAAFSKLFSENKKPYINSRATENIFCKSFGADNLSRSDVTADAKKDEVGIGIKTWIDTRYQKVAEFNKQKPEFEKLSNKSMIKKIAELRNQRIDFTMRTYQLEQMVYHCVERSEGKVTILEGTLDKINVESIGNIKRNKNVITFEDGLHQYGFNISKSTLYMHFNFLTQVDQFDIQIDDDPYELIASMQRNESQNDIVTDADRLIEVIYLPLYSYNVKKGKYIPPKNNLNIRFAAGRKRNAYEIGIPVPKEFRDKYPDFFPGRNRFELRLPNGQGLEAKCCQDAGKSIMSKPNKALGHWIIDDVLKIDPSVKITYQMLEKYGVDSVVIEKRKEEHNDQVYYTINFAVCDSYEIFMGHMENSIENV